MTQQEYITRYDMKNIAHAHNFIISKSTIYRWASEPQFPRPVGQKGACLLYSREAFLNFLERRLTRIQMDN